VPESNNGAMHDEDLPTAADPRHPRHGRLRRLLRRLSDTLPESRTDRAVVLATLTAIILVGGSSVAIFLSPSESESLAFDAPTLVTVSEPSSTTTTIQTTSSTTLTVPVPPVAAPRTNPQAPPQNARAATPIVQIGEMRIPKIGLVHPVYEGVTLTVIDKGPGHWPGSAMPGELGNTVFAGHRVTHTRPMRNIDRLVAGDEVLFTTNAGTFTYRVTGHEIVTPKDVHIVNPTPDATMTIFGCHPPGSAKQRYVVRGALASSTPA